MLLSRYILCGAGSAGKYLSSLLDVTNPQDEQFVNANDDEEHIDQRYQTGYTNATKKSRKAEICQNRFFFIKILGVGFGVKSIFGV